MILLENLLIHLVILPKAVLSLAFNAPGDFKLFGLQKRRKIPDQFSL